MKSLTYALSLASTACFSCLLSQSPSPPQLSAPQSRRNPQRPPPASLVQSVSGLGTPSLSKALHKAWSHCALEQAWLLSLEPPPRLGPRPSVP